MRRLLILAVVVLGLLVAADRIGVVLAERVVAKRIQQDQHLASRPDVSIGGFPFLTQLVGGRYDDVTLVVDGYQGGGVRVERVTADLSGVHVPFSAVLHQSVNRVRTDRARADVLVSYADVNRFLADKHIQLGPGPGGSVHVTVSRTVAGQTLTASGDGRVQVSGDQVEISADPGIDVTIPLPRLPFQIRLIRAEATQNGIDVAASAEGLVVDTSGP